MATIYSGDGGGRSSRARMDEEAEALLLANGEYDSSRWDSHSGERDKAQARLHALAEHSLTVRQALAIYRKGICWCLAVSACVIMEGYDMILIGNFFAYPTFAAKYGQFVDATGQPQLSATWQAILGNSAAVGCLLGSWLNGWLVDACGQKRVLLGSLASLAALVCVPFFAPNIGLLAAGEFLCGLPWGAFASSAPTYASELLPQGLRGYLTSYTNMCFILGQLIAAVVLAGLVRRDDEWAYRIPFALQWAWPTVLFPLLWFAPESPWHLVRTGRLAEAERSIRRTQASGCKDIDGLDPQSTMAFIVRTDRLERMLASTNAHTGKMKRPEKKDTDGTSYWDCLRGTDRRRTEIACLAFAAQVLAGAPFAYNSTYFFQQVGLSTHMTYHLNTVGTALALAGTVVNWLVLMPRYGRRPIVLGGMLALASLLAVIGVLAVLARAGDGGAQQQQKRTLGLVQAALALIWTFVFQTSIGQLGWAIPSEVGSTRLRQKTVCLARNTYYVVNILANVVQPFMLNPHALNLKGAAGFFWVATALLVLVWAFFRLPETKGRSYDELDWMFAKGTPARQFAATRVPDVFGGASQSGLGRQGSETGKGDDSDDDTLEMDALVPPTSGAQSPMSSDPSQIL